MLLAVACGAFAAHALKERLSPAMFDVWHTAVTYHMVHALGLLAIGLLSLQLPAQRLQLQRAGWIMLLGKLLFCGSLYTLALTNLRWLGAITPFGGILFLLAWFLLAKCKT